MNNRLKFVLIVLVLLTCMVGLRDSYRATAQRNPLTSTVRQGQTRIVVTTTDLRPPIKITNVKAKGREIETDRHFQDDDDWLRGLTIRLINQSEKTVTFVEVLGMFHRTEDQMPGLPAGWPFSKGIDPFGPEVLGEAPKFEPVLPGGQIEIVLSDLEYEEIRRFLKDVQFPNAIKRLELEVIKIGFSDGTAWNTNGTYKRDPKNIKGPLKGWTPVEADGNEPDAKKSPGSAQTRTALLLVTNILSFDSEAPWQFLRTRWSEVPVQTTECGKASTVGLGGCSGLTECFYERSQLSPVGLADALQPFSAPCTLIVNGKKFNCGNQLSTKRIPCPNPTPTPTPTPTPNPTLAKETGLPVYLVGNVAAESVRVAYAKLALLKGR